MPTIIVNPSDGRGWSLDVEGVLNPQVCRSGARAEAAAKALARRLVLAGAPAAGTLHLRDGSKIAAVHAFDAEKAANIPGNGTRRNRPVPFDGKITLMR